MIILQKNKVIFDNVITNRKNPYPSLGIYLISYKVAQFRLMDKNKREKEQANKKKAKKTTSRKLCLQEKRSEDFQKYQDSMNSLLLSTTEESKFINIINLYSNNQKENFSYLVGNLDKLPNQRRETAARKIIQLLKSGPQQVPPP